MALPGEDYKLRLAGIRASHNDNLVLYFGYLSDEGGGGGADLRCDELDKTGYKKKGLTRNSVQVFSFHVTQMPFMAGCGFCQKKCLLLFVMLWDLSSFFEEVQEDEKVLGRMGRCIEGW